MKHATPARLDELEPLLEALRAVPAFKERGRGVFYAKSRATLHFHEDASGIYADFKEGDDWQRFRVSTLIECERLLATVHSRFGAA